MQNKAKPGLTAVVITTAMTIAATLTGAIPATAATTTTDRVEIRDVVAEPPDTAVAGEIATVTWRAKVVAGDRAVLLRLMPRVHVDGEPLEIAVQDATCTPALMDPHATAEVTCVGTARVPTGVGGSALFAAALTAVTADGRSVGDVRVTAPVNVSGSPVVTVDPVPQPTVTVRCQHSLRLHQRSPGRGMQPVISHWWAHQAGEVGAACGAAAYGKGRYGRLVSETAMARRVMRLSQGRPGVYGVRAVSRYVECETTRDRVIIGCGRPRVEARAAAFVAWRASRS